MKKMISNAKTPAGSMFGTLWRCRMWLYGETSRSHLRCHARKTKAFGHLWYLKSFIEFYWKSFGDCWGPVFKTVGDLSPPLDIMWGPSPAFWSLVINLQPAGRHTLLRLHACVLYCYKWACIRYIFMLCCTQLRAYVKNYYLQAATTKRPAIPSQTRLYF